MNLTCIDLGRASYQAALDRQMELVAQVQGSPDAGGYLLLVEHDPPVITLGRRGKAGHILASPEKLAAQGIEVHSASRGGEVTWHGPGQLVAYPIVPLRGLSMSLHQYVEQLEGAVIDLLAGYGIAGQRRQGLTGVWVDDRKIAAIGVALSRWVCYHGLALNVQPDLASFGLIVPCGQADGKVTSMERVLGRSPDMSEVKARLAECLTRAFRPARLPPWLKKRIAGGPEAAGVRKLLDGLGLATVCSSAQCPNQPECFAARTATFMIMGEHCTRNCRFCAVESRPPSPLRADEPQAVAAACAELGLRHVVITSVTRDDLPDGGAGHFAATIQSVRQKLPRSVVEVLTPDFQGDAGAIRTVLEARPDIFNHNVETVPRLYAQVRPQAQYRRSLEVLRLARAMSGQMGIALHTKSGMMVGLGESLDEVVAVMGDLRAVDCEIITIGQYLRPSPRHLPVARFVTPEEFAGLERRGREMGFKAVQAGPFVRSSYHAREVFDGVSLSF